MKVNEEKKKHWETSASQSFNQSVRSFFVQVSSLQFLLFLNCEL